MKRRQLIVAGAAALAAPSIARAQGKFPERTIRFVIPFAPGGPTDIIGRMVADKLTGILGQQVIVDNKAGAAGSIGAVDVKNAKPDSYTLLCAPSSTHAINPTAFVKPAYDAVKDFTPIASICVNPLVLVARPDMPDTVMGQPARSAAWRAMLAPLAPSGVPQPMMTSSTSAASMPARWMAC